MKRNLLISMASIVSCRSLLGSGRNHRHKDNHQQDKYPYRPANPFHDSVIATRSGKEKQCRTKYRQSGVNNGAFSHDLPPVPTRRIGGTKPRILSVFSVTDNELVAISSAANSGLTISAVKGYKRPIPSGMASVL